MGVIRMKKYRIYLVSFQVSLSGYAWRKEGMSLEREGAIVGVYVGQDIYPYVSTAGNLYKVQYRVLKLNANLYFFLSKALLDSSCKKQIILQYLFSNILNDKHYYYIE